MWFISRRKEKRKLELLKMFWDSNDNNEIPSLTTETIKHSENYTKLIETYVDSVNRNSIVKIVLKIIFFVITMLILLGIVIAFCVISINISKAIKRHNITLTTITGIISVMIPAISSLIVALLKIPEIIAEYLFNTEEDYFMNEIIRNIQEHDKAMYAMNHKADSFMKENEMKEVPKDVDLEKELLEDIT